MKRICITYHMHKPGESAETCVTLPVSNHIAKNLLEYENDSIYIKGFRTSTQPGAIEIILREMALIQGYEYTGAVSFEEVNYQ